MGTSKESISQHAGECIGCWIIGKKPTSNINWWWWVLSNVFSADVGDGMRLVQWMDIYNAGPW